MLFRSVTSQLGGRLSHLFEGGRQRLIFSSFCGGAVRFGEWNLVPYLAMAVPLLGLGWRRMGGREWIVALVIALMLAGYYGVYLLTPWDLKWHLDSSLVRLLLQLWPAALFFWCLAASCTGDWPIAPSAVRPSWVRVAAIVLVNLVVAAGIMNLCSRQLALNELDAAPISGAQVRVAIGEGWFPRESDRHDTWLWSKGRSSLSLHASASATAGLHFGLRSLGERTVTAKIGNHAIWTGLVGDRLIQVDVIGVQLQVGTTMVDFETLRPGVCESTRADARILTFALYNLRVR